MFIFLSESMELCKHGLMVELNALEVKRLSSNQRTNWELPVYEELCPFRTGMVGGVVGRVNIGAKIGFDPTLHDRFS